MHETACWGGASARQCCMQGLPYCVLCAVMVISKVLLGYDNFNVWPKAACCDGEG